METCPRAQDVGRQGRVDMPIRIVALAVVVFVTCLVALGLSTDVLVDWLWFSSLGYASVFWTMVEAKAVIFFAVLAASAGVLWLNGALASRFARPRTTTLALHGGRAGSQALRELFKLAPPWLSWRLLVPVVAVAIGTLIAAGEMGNWGVALRFIHQVPYGTQDPLYGRDVGFYLFSLPAYVALKNWILLVLVASAMFAFAVYAVERAIDFDRRPWRFSPPAVAHGSALLGVFFAIKAWSYGLDRFLLVYGDNGVVVGASYTDVHVELPVLWFLLAIAAAAALACWVNVRLRTYRVPLAALGLVFGSSLVLGTLFPGLFQRLSVKPNELQLETPYIQRNIVFTRDAYNLRQIAVKPFPAEQDLMGQSPSALHPRQWRRDVSGDPEIRRRIADTLPPGHPARGVRRPCDQPAAPVFRPGRRDVRDRQDRHQGVRLSQGQRQRLFDL